MNIAMAQSKSFFGHRRGSTKSHTYQVNAGQQITKDRVDEVKNPRTSAQMVHRCCLHTLSDAHAYLRPFIGRFWEGAQSPAASLAAFRKANYPIIRAAAESASNRFSFSPFKETTTPTGYFQLSAGSLGAWYIGMSNPSISQSTISANISRKTSKNKLFSEVLLELGLKVGDIVTFIYFVLNRARTQYLLKFASLKIKDAEDINWGQLSYNDIFSVVASSDGLSFDTKSSNIYFVRLKWSVPYASINSDMLRYASILQRKVGSKISFNNAFMRGTNANSYWPTFQQAIATYPQGGSNALNGDPL